MTAEYTPDQTPPRQCPECGGLFGHTADCPNRVGDRAVVVAEALAEHAHPGEILVSLGDAWMTCGCGLRIDVTVTSDKQAKTGDANREWMAHVTAAILAALDTLPAQGIREDERERLGKAVTDAYWKGRMQRPPDPDSPSIPDEPEELAQRRAALAAQVARASGGESDG